MSIIITKKGNKKIATIDNFAISGGTYLANATMTPSNTYWGLPVHSSASLRVIIMVNVSKQSSGYLFGDSVFNIKLEGTSVTWKFADNSHTQSVTEGIHYLGFIDGKPALNGELLSHSSITATVSSNNCYLASANLSGATPLSNTKIIKVEVYGHSSTSSDITSYWSYYGVRQSGTNAGYLAEKWSSTIIERLPQGSCTAQSGGDNDIQWGISIDDLRQVINTPYKDLVAIVAEDNDIGITGDSYDAIKDANGDVVYKSAFCLKDTPLPSGHRREDNALYPSLERGDLIPARTPKWNLWSDGFSFGKFFRPNYATADSADTITYSYNGQYGQKNVNNNQKGHLSVNFLYDGNGVKHSDELVHLEDFEGYRYGEFHKPAIYLDGVEVDDFNEIVSDENGGASIQPRKLLTTMFGGYPIGGGEVGPYQMHTVEGYPMYECDLEGYEGVIYFVKDGVVYTKNINGKDIQVSGLLESNLRPYYYKDENGIEGEKINHKSIFYTSFTKNKKDYAGNNYFEEVGGSDAIYKYIPPSGFDFRFKIGNLVNWHKANTYLDASGNALPLKGAYFALRLVDTIDADLTDDVNEVFGIPLMLGYKLDDNILGSATSETLKNELIETGVTVEDVWNKLPTSFTQAIKVYALRNARYTCYGEIGLLGNGFDGSEAQIANFSNYAYTARRLFKQMTANLYMDSYDGTNVILKGFDRSYSLNGESYDIRICARPKYKYVEGVATTELIGNDIMVLPRNKGVSLAVTVEKGGEMQAHIAVKANLTIYREVREYETNPSLSGYDFLTIKSITNYKSPTLTTISTTASKTDVLYKAIASVNEGYGVKRFNINGGEIGEVTKGSILAGGSFDADNYYPYLTWNAEDFLSDGASNDIVELLSSNSEEYTTTDTTIFKDNCTFVIEITGIESKS